MAGRVYIAPGGGHLEVRRGEDGAARTRVSDVGKGDHYVPSVDRLFVSLAESFPGPKLGVILTGMGSDGAAGVRALHDAGGHTMAESASSAIVYGMPKEAVATGCVDDELPLVGIIDEIQAFAAITSGET